MLIRILALLAITTFYTVSFSMEQKQQRDKYAIKDNESGKIIKIKLKPGISVEKAKFKVAYKLWGEYRNLCKLKINGNDLMETALPAIAENVVIEASKFSPQQDTELTVRICQKNMIFQVSKDDTIGTLIDKIKKEIKLDETKCIKLFSLGAVVPNSAPVVFSEQLAIAVVENFDYVNVSINNYSGSKETFCTQQCKYCPKEYVEDFLRRVRKKNKFPSNASIVIKGKKLNSDEEVCLKRYALFSKYSGPKAKCPVNINKLSIYISES